MSPATCSPLRVASRDADPDTLTVALRALAQPATWDNPDIRRRFSTGLPGYRLSKFQDALPAAASWELIAATLLDEAGAMGYLAEVG